MSCYVALRDISFILGCRAPRSTLCKDTMLDDVWWEMVDLAIRNMDPIIFVLRFLNTTQPILEMFVRGRIPWLSLWRTLLCRMSVLSMEHQQRTYGPPYKIFLSPRGIRPAHIFIDWLTHWNLGSTIMSGPVVGPLANSLTWMERFHEGGR